jgi:hypothetical protein
MYTPVLDCRTNNLVDRSNSSLLILWNREEEKTDSRQDRWMVDRRGPVILYPQPYVRPARPFI